MAKANGSGAGKPNLADRSIARLLSMGYRIPTINLDEYEVHADILALVPRALCEELDVLPVSRAGTSLIVATADPTNERAVKALAEHTGFVIELVVASTEAIRAALRKYYGDR